MTAMFHVGQKVVCVDDGGTPDRIWMRDAKPTVGAIYTVAETGVSHFYTRAPNALRLCEIRNVWHGRDIGYDVSRFRPVHSIQIFHDIANGVKQPEKVTQ